MSNLLPEQKLTWTKTVHQKQQQQQQKGPPGSSHYEKPAATTVGFSNIPSSHDQIAAVSATAGTITAAVAQPTAATTETDTKAAAVETAAPRTTRFSRLVTSLSQGSLSTDPVEPTSAPPFSCSQSQTDRKGLLASAKVRKGLHNINQSFNNVN